MDDLNNMWITARNPLKKFDDWCQVARGCAVAAAAAISRKGVYAGKGFFDSKGLPLRHVAKPLAGKQKTRRVTPGLEELQSGRSIRPTAFSNAGQAGRLSVKQCSCG